MSEQKRLLIAVALSIMIISGWQMLMSELQPPPEMVEDPISSTTLNNAASGQNTVDKNGDVKLPQVDGETPDLANDQAVESQVAVQIPEVRHELETSLMTSELTNKGGIQFTSLKLRKYKERLEKEVEEESENPIIPGLVSLLAGKEEQNQWQGRFIWELGAVSQPEFEATKTGNKVVFKSVNIPNLKTEIEVTTRAEGYGFDYRVEVANIGALAAPIGLTMELAAENTVEDVGFGASEVSLQGICGFQEEIERNTLADLEEGPWNSNQPTDWSSIDLQYFVLALTGKDPLKSFGGPCEMSANGKILTLSQRIGKDTLNPGQKAEFEFSFYAGPKRDEQLLAVSPKLTDIIDYDFIGIPLGFLARPMVFLLNLFHGFTASWGLAIVFLTLTVKAILFPVTYKSVVSMRKMQLIKPELDKIKERWPDDREKQQMEQLKIFKEKGINPLGGCLPMLLQMPVWVALYRMLWSSVDLYQQPFLWLVDLTAKEPFPLLAIGIGILTFVQQKTTPTSTDSQQAKVMMMVMPFMLTFFMLALPSGLVLYIFVNSVLTIFQTLAINKRTPAL